MIQRADRIVAQVITGLILAGVGSAATVFLVCVIRGIGKTSVYAG